MKLSGQFVVVALVALAAAGFWRFQDDLPWIGGNNTASAKRSDKAKIVTVEIAPARSATIPLTLQAVGTLTAAEAVALTAKVTGLVKSVSFTEGQWVERGTILVDLDASELQAELEKARAERQNAQQLHARAMALVKSRNVSAARVDELGSQLAATDAAVRAREAELASYQIRAPFSGRIGLRDLSVGALVQPGDIITTLDDTRVMKLDFEVPEVAIAAVKAGLGVTARSGAYPGRPFRGTVATVDPRVDPVTRSVKIRARIPNEDGVLKPGMFLNVTLAVGENQNAILIPEEAILATPTGHFVFTIDNGVAYRRVVKIGRRLTGQAEILDGLTVNAQVVVGGIQKLRDGRAVRIRDRAPAAKP